ncbi:peptidyl-prolyl cis-trans isomerase [Neobacillus sp. SM06]|uniref:peptidyl-prolyl cis-trans isomerase n=1 Tax=Neobacillus sp. SM06 TaxID=3422492 RepID=UPI003D2B698D
MRKKELWLIIAGLIFINILTIVFFFGKSGGVTGTAAYEQVATVGGKTISRQDWLNELEARYGKEVLKEMIDQKVIQEMADKYKITVSDKDVERQLRMAQATYGPSATASYTSDENKWKEQVKNNLLLEEILTKDVVVSESEMKKYYQENQAQFQIPTAYHLSHILVKTKDDAKKALKELSQGSSFSALAMERSIEEFSANQGGDIGYISQDDEQYPPEYIKIAKKLKPGTYSSPIKVKQGYAILKLHKVIKGQAFTYEEVKSQIRRQIAMEQMKVPASASSFWDEVKVDWFYGNTTK